MKSVLICAFISALEIAQAIPSPEAQWGPGFDDATEIDVFEKIDSSCTVTWRGNQVSGTCVASDEPIPQGLISVTSADCIATGGNPMDGSVKCQVGPITCGGSNNFCFNPDEPGACQGKTLSFTIKNDRVSYLCPDRLVCCVQGASSTGGQSPSGRPNRSRPQQQTQPGTDSTPQPPTPQPGTDSTTPQPSTPQPGTDSTTPQPSTPQPGTDSTTPQPPTPQPGTDSTTPQPPGTQPINPGTQQPGDSTTSPRRMRRPTDSSTPQSTPDQPPTSPTPGEGQPQQIPVPRSGAPSRRKTAVAFADTGDSLFTDGDF